MARAKKTAASKRVAQSAAAGAVATERTTKSAPASRKKSANPARCTTHVQRASRAAHVPTDAQFRRWVNAALADRTNSACELTLRVVGPAEMQTLNREYRGKDYATNVLSFPFETPAGVELPVHVLGDIVLCANTVQREAKEQGKPVAAHWAHLTVHGVLHLLGMDHQHDRDAQKMESAEISVLSMLKIANPYRLQSHSKP